MDQDSGIDVEDAPRVKRFKHLSYSDSIKDIHLPSAFRQANTDDLEDNESYFREALNQWKLQCLAPAFVQFARQADPLSESMASLLHNWQKVVDLLVNALEILDDEVLKPVLSLLQNLTQDLRTTLLPSYKDILDRLVHILAQSIPASSFTVLLTTFASVYKNVLIPSSDMDLFKMTWASLRTAMPMCIPEAQKAIAEVWGLALRVAKSPARETLALTMAETLEDIEDVCAWMFVFACKSISQSLHTSTTSLLSTLLTYHLSCSNPSQTYKLIRRLLTSLIHHCKSAEQFSSVADYLVNEYSTILSSKSIENDHERLSRILRIVSIPCAVRGGSRLAQRHISALLSHFEVLPITTFLHPVLLEFTTSVLTAGDTSQWLGPGRRLLERSWEHPTFGVKLCGALSELEWRGFKMFALPAAIASVMHALEVEPLSTLRLLVVLFKTGMLNNVDKAWSAQLDQWVCRRFTDRSIGDEFLIELNSVLELSPMLPSLPKFLVSIVDLVLSSEHSKRDSNASRMNAWILGSCMQCLAQRSANGGLPHVDYVSWTRRCTENWSWSANVLRGLVGLVQTSSSASELPLAETPMYQLVQASLLSHSRALRLSTLQLLSWPIMGLSPEQREVVKGCLQAEEVSPDIQGVRERTYRIQKMAQAVPDRDELAAEVCTRWLIAQFKVNLRPIWSPASEALASLSQRFDGIVWRLMFEELRHISQAPAPESSPVRMESEALETHHYPNNSPEHERSWRDPSGHRLGSVVANWQNGATSVGEIVKSPDERDCDPASYEAQLLSALAECSRMAERHNRDLVLLFLSHAGIDSSSPLPRRKLTAWLTLFSKFTNPKALHSTETLYRLYVSRLSHPDRNIQSLALSCILTYKSPNLFPNQDKLHAFLDETRWRDEMTLYDFDATKDQERVELVDVIIRILFGSMLRKTDRSRSSNRAAVLTCLSRCSEPELGLLVKLMLNVDGMSPHDDQSALQLVHETMSWREQLGFLTLLGDVLRHLGSRIASHWPLLISTTVKLLGHAQRWISVEQGGHKIVEDEVGDVENFAEEVHEGQISHAVVRSVRQLAIKRFSEFFQFSEAFDFEPYVEEAFRNALSPRLALLDVENTQAPSALLGLFYSWVSRAEYTQYLVRFDTRVIPKIYACLIARNVHTSVLSRIFDIIEKLLAFSDEDPSIADTIIKPHVSLLLSNMAILVERTKGNATFFTSIGQRQIGVLSEIAQYVTEAGHASTFLSLLSPLLSKPSKLVSERVKTGMLKVIANVVLLIPELSDCNSVTFSNFYPVLAKLFRDLRTRSGQEELLNAFRCLAKVNSSLLSLADLLGSLNAYSSKRLEEPDFDRRLSAFGLLNEIHQTLPVDHWLPLLYNMLRFIQDPTELAIRTHAGSSLKKFTEQTANSSSPEYERMFMRILYPGIKLTLRSKNELVRSEALNVLEFAVSTCGRLNSLQDMRILLASGDEEVNFFKNFQHVQIHRRTRALRRLAEQCNEGQFRSDTVAGVLIPLVGNYVVSAPSVDHTLVNEAITATGQMARRLSWGAYHSLAQKYLRASQTHDESERVCVRALVAILQSFHFPMEDTVPDSEMAEGESDEDDAVNPGNFSNDSQASKAISYSRIADAVNLRLLPSLLRYLDNNDEAEGITRIPIAIGIVEVAKHLPTSSREAHIARLLTILSQALRSHSQDTRDLVRDALRRVAVTLGPYCLSLMIKEMRQALTRGPQLHVLGYTTHALLVHATAPEHVDRFGMLDECVGDVVHVSAEVIFGESGKDVQAEGFKTKMGEVRASYAKGLDSFSIIAMFLTPPRISSLLIPLKAIMSETDSRKVMERVEEVLRRIATGLNANKHLEPKELLVLCNTLIAQDSRFLKPKLLVSKVQHNDDAIVQMKRKVEMEKSYYVNNSYRFVVFGLELFHTALKRGRFDLNNPLIRSRLEAMVSVVGNSLYTNIAAVLVLGMKTVTSIVKCPLKSLERSIPVFVQQMINIVKQNGNTDSDVVQVALKSLAAILRDRPNVEIKEKDLSFLLDVVSPDLEEPVRQVAAFTILRAIISRKFIVPEIYDMMDRVSHILVTSQVPHVQELCRLAFLQFLLDYPQGKGKLRNHLTFLANNLSYPYESGRKSVMELLSAVISKFEVGLLRAYSDLIFIALVLVLANDDSGKCREMAGVLIKALLNRLDDQHRKVVLSHLHAWSTQRSQPQIAAVSSQVYGITVDLLQQESLPYVLKILEDINSQLASSAQEFTNMLIKVSNDNSEIVPSSSWQVPYYAFTALEKILRVYPDYATNQDKIIWPDVVLHLVFPHAWVRVASCRLLGLYFTALPPGPPNPLLPDTSPLSRQGMRNIAEKLCMQLKSIHLDATLSLQVVKNLFYLGKCFYAVPVVDTAEPEMPSEDEGEAQSPAKDQNLLSWLFLKLSNQARSAYTARRNQSTAPSKWAEQPTAVLKWFAAMTSYMESARLEPFLNYILMPLYRLIEDDTIHDSQIVELKALAVELRDMVQSKVGVNAFAHRYSRIRESVLSVQRERRNARVRLAMKNPEAAARRKILRNAIKKQSRKRKSKQITDSRKAKRPDQVE